MAFKEYVGEWDLAQGTITDSESGEVFTVPEWRLEVEERQREELEEVVDRTRDTLMDDQCLPGRKPYFVDDWMGIIPTQVKPVGLYPYELGYRSGGPLRPAPES